MRIRAMAVVLYGTVHRSPSAQPRCADASCVILLAVYATKAVLRRFET